MMKRKALIVFLLLIAVSILAIYGYMRHRMKTELPLSISLSFSDSTFSKNDPVIAKIVIQNISNTPTIVNARLLLAPGLGEIWFHITDMNGEPVVFTSSIQVLPAKKDQMLLLAPGESLVAEYDVSNWYAIGSPGKYDISVQYHNLRSFEDMSVWVGDIFSETIRIEIEE